MEVSNIILQTAIIFAGAALLSTLFLYLKQPVILAYIFWGVIAGPAALKLIESPEQISQVSKFGIIFLMFLLGLNLHPNKLMRLFKNAALVTISSSICFSLITFIILILFKIPMWEAIIGGLAMMFSSTVISLKLCPTTTLHQQHQGEIMTSTLLFQDLIAVVIILILGSKSTTHILGDSIFLILKLAGLIAVAIILVKLLLLRLLRRYDIIQDYIFLTALAWCLIFAELAHFVGLSHEIGAFIAGISIATSPVALYIAESMKPLREFFLILFFFAIGANFNPGGLAQIAIPAIIIAILLIVLKPLIFKIAFHYFGEERQVAKNLGLRLGQSSEFSLLLLASALGSEKISLKTSSMMQLATVLTFVISTYIVVLRMPTPIAVSADKRQD